MILESRAEGPVVVLTLNRPEVGNALSPELLADLGAALAEIDGDASVHAVVLTGAGDRVFCSGMDLKAFAMGAGGAAPGTGGSSAAGGSPAAAARDDARSAAAQESLFAGEYPTPVVAAVNGAAVGGGLELVLGADVVVAAAHARFGLPEVKRGLFPAGRGTLLPTRIPLAVALEMGLTGELIGAARAAELGLVNQVVPADQLLVAAIDLATRIAANGPLGVRLTKRLMRAAVQRGPEHGRATSDQAMEVFGSEDAREGATAFAEKRPPRFTGR